MIAAGTRLVPVIISRMFAAVDFLWAIISDGWAMFSTLLSIASVGAAVTHHTGNFPAWFFWMLGFVGLFITAGRIWHKEYRKAGPVIILECARERSGDDEFILENRGPEDAFDVKIQNICRGEDGYASFDSTKVKAGDKSIVKAIVHKNPRGSLLFQSRFTDFILKTADTPNLRAAFAGTIVPISIEYRSVNNQRYRSTFTVVFFPQKDKVSVNLVSYRRIFRSSLTFPRLSRRDR